MAGVIKYSTTTPTNQSTLRKGNTVVAVGNDAISQFRANGFSSGVDIPLGGYVVYTIGLNNNPKLWVANTENNLIPIARTLGGNPTTAADAKYYICSVTDAWILDNPINNIVTDGLILNLDASNLSSYPGTNTSFMDLSGNNNNGTLGSGIGFNSNGWVNFNGTQTSNYNIAVPIDRAELGNNMSIEATFKYEGAAGDGYRPIIGGNDPGAGTEVFFGKNSGNTNFGVQDGNYAGSFVTNYNVFDGEWHHMVYTYDNGTGKIYLDGTLKNSGTFTKANNAEQIYIGAEVQEGYWWDGDISQVKYYTKTLSSSEVLQNYYQSPITTDSLYFSIDANNLVSFESGSTIAYSLTGSVNGTIAGATFDGSTGGSWVFGSNRNTYLKAGSNPGPFDFPGWDGYTVDIWVKRTAFGTWQSGGTTNYDGIWNYYWNHNLSFTGAHTGVNRIQGSGISGGYDIEMDTWYNVIMTHDNGSSVGNHKVYINGKLEFTANVSNASYSSGNPRQFFIGNWDSGWSMVGEIGNIQVYDRHLTETEAVNNYNAQRNRFVNVAPNPIETDGDYLKVFRQDSSNGAFFSSANSWVEARRTNDDNPQADKYSILNTVENYKLNSKYTFKLVYPKLGLYNIWSQRNNPVNDDGSGGVDSYVGIDIQMTSNGWGGLERYDAQNSTFLDGTLVPQGNWYYAIGSKSWGSPTTFPGYNSAVDEVELWVKYK